MLELKLCLLCVGATVFAQQISQNLPDDVTPPPEEPSRCGTSRALIQILGELLTALTPPLRGGAAPSGEHIDNVLELVERFLRRAPSAFHDIDTDNKFKDLEDQLQRSRNVERGALALRRPDAACRAALAELLHVAYLTYLQLAGHPGCARVGDGPAVSLPDDSLQGLLAAKPNTVANIPPTGPFGVGVPRIDGLAQRLALLNLPANSNSLLTNIDISREPAVPGAEFVDPFGPAASVPAVQRHGRVLNPNGTYWSTAQSSLNNPPNNSLQDNSDASTPITADLLVRLEHATNLPSNQKNNFTIPMATANAKDNAVASSTLNYVNSNDYNLLSAAAVSDDQNVASFANLNPNNIEQVIYEKRLIKTLGGQHSHPGAMATFTVVGRNPLLTRNGPGYNPLYRPNTSSLNGRPLNPYYNIGYYQQPVEVVNNYLKGPQSIIALKQQQQSVSNTQPELSELFTNSLQTAQRPQQTVLKQKQFLSSFKYNNMLSDAPNRPNTSSLNGQLLNPYYNIGYNQQPVEVVNNYLKGPRSIIALKQQQQSVSNTQPELSELFTNSLQTAQRPQQTVLKQKQFLSSFKYNNMLSDAPNRPNTSSLNGQPLNPYYNIGYYQQPAEIVSNDLKGIIAPKQQQQSLPKTQPELNELFTNSLQTAQRLQQTVQPQYEEPTHNKQYLILPRLVPQVQNLPQNSALLDPQQQYAQQQPPRATGTGGQKALPHPQIPYRNQQQTLPNTIISDLNNVNPRNAPAGPNAVELTYVLRSAPVYEPDHFVKYKMSYAELVAALEELLARKPYLRSYPDKLYYELLNKSNISGVSPDLKHYNSDDIHKLVDRAGAFVDAKVINDNDAALSEQLRIVQGLNSNLQVDDILKTLSVFTETTHRSSDVGTASRMGAPVARAEGVNAPLPAGAAPPAARAPPATRATPPIAAAIK